MVFSEHEFEGVEQFPTPSEAWAYSRGVTRGSGLYGGDRCHAYVLPDEDHDMHSIEPDDQIARGMKKLEEKFGHKAAFA